MTQPLYPEIRGCLIANADDVAHSLIEKWGSAVVGEPTYSEENGWHIEVLGLLDDIHMDTIWVYANGSREKIV